MTCIIYAKSKHIPANIWQYVKNDINYNTNIHYDFKSLLQKSLNYVEEEFEVKKGFGIFFRDDSIGNKVYVITCFHIIGKVNLEVNAYANTKNNIFSKFPLKLVKVIEELDIAILEFKNENHENDINYYTQSNSLCKINETLQKKTNIKMSYSNIKENILTEHNINIDKFEMEYDYLKSTIIPKIPLYKFAIDLNKFPEKIIDNIYGLSGSILKIDDNPIAITVSYNNMKLEAIPIGILYNIVTKFIQNKNALVSSFYFSSKVIELTNSKKETDICHFIVDNKNITYNISHDKNKFKFKDNDIIYSVNDNKFTKNGTIMVNELGCELPLDIYLMLYSYGSDVAFQIYRIISDTHKLLSYNLIGQPFENIYNINIFANNNYLYWKGLIFTELSEELILDINKLGINLIGNHFEKYKIIDPNVSKTVVLIDINYKLLDETSKYVLLEIGLPYVKYKNGYTLLILEKIGLKNILSLKDLKNIVHTKPNKITCTCTNGNKDTEFKIII